MKSPMLPIKIALIGVGLLAGAAGRSNAGIVINPSPLSESRLGYIADGVTQGFKQVYDSSGVKTLLTGGTLSDGGTSSYSDGEVAISNTNTGKAFGTTFDLKSTASAQILKSTAAFAYAHGINEYLDNFQVSSPQTFKTSVSLSAAASLSGANTSFEYLALAYLYDTTTSIMLYDTSYIFSNGKGSSYGVPASVDLLPGHQYTLVGETFTYAEILNLPGSGLGSVSGSAEVRFSLLAAPEPSTLAVASLGTLGLIFHVRRRRRSAF